ncbi:BolA family protein [Marinobacterium jannaschii]|uniref:BolA family protein n=1 Tax=Marinobacterium jannaschii TaxID=64970 RepID=UPI000488E9EA|nr:BolA/IbaG family iron-sulfur metabolism protein [Marinobacterium jannaschii]
MSVQNTIETKLQAGLNVLHMEIENESHMHSGPATDSHFKLTLVSDDFEGKRLVQRHQLIFGLLSDEMQNPIHALSMHLYTQAEWQARNGAIPSSPECMGGSKADH